MDIGDGGTVSMVNCTLTGNTAFPSIGTDTFLDALLFLHTRNLA